MDAVDFFGDAPEASSIFSRKLDILLTWSVTPLQYGDHRPYAAACLLRGWRDKAKERAIRRDVANPDEQIQDQLFDWLDSSAAAGDVGNLPAVSLLFGELVRHELFSYAKYMQRLIARGEPGLSFNDVSTHVHDYHANTHIYHSAYWIQTSKFHSRYPTSQFFFGPDQPAQGHTLWRTCSGNTRRCE